MIIANLTQNAKTAQQMIAEAVERLPYARTCECASALKYAHHHPAGRDSRAGQAGAGADHREVLS